MAKPAVAPARAGMTGVESLMELNSIDLELDDVGMVEDALEDDPESAIDGADIDVESESEGSIAGDDQSEGEDDHTGVDPHGMAGALVEDDHTGVDPHGMAETSAEDDHTGVDPHGMAGPSAEDEGLGEDGEASPGSDLDIDEKTSLEPHPSLGSDASVTDEKTSLELHPSLGSDASVEDDRTEPAGRGMRIQRDTEVVLPGLRPRSLPQAPAQPEPRQALPQAWPQLADQPRPAPRSALPGVTPMPSQSARPAQAEPAPPPVARPAVPGARPAISAKVSGQAGPAAPESDATVPLDKESLFLPASLSVLADDGVDPSPEYVAAREAALRAVRAQKRMHGQATPMPALKRGAITSQFRPAGTGAGGTGTGGTGTGGMDTEGTDTEGMDTDDTGTARFQKPTAFGSRIQRARLFDPDSRALERSYTDALAAIDLADVYDDDDPLLDRPTEPTAPNPVSSPEIEFDTDSSASLRALDFRTPTPAAVPPARSWSQSGQTPVPVAQPSLPLSGPARVPVAQPSLPLSGPAPVPRHDHTPGHHAAAAPIAQSQPFVPAQQGALDIYDEHDEDAPAPAAPVSPQPASHWVPNPKRPRRIKRPRGPAPGFTNAEIPSERNPVRLGFGLMIMAAGLTLLLWFLPQHAPLGQKSGPDDTAAERAGDAQPYVWRYSPALYRNARIAAAGFVVVGILFMLNGMYFKPRAEIVCKRCKRYVIAQRDMVSLKCPRSSHAAGLCYKTVFIIALLLACVAVTLFMVAEANIIRGG